MILETLTTVPVSDAASRFLREHPGGAPLFPGGSLASEAAVARRAARLEAWGATQPGGEVAARERLAAWLRDQNAFAPLAPAQEANLAAAARPDALFVLTGQQPGLLGGPALGFSKAMSAIAWARGWSARLGRPVIPVFWVAGDDSDLAESGAAEFLEADAKSSVVSLAFDDPDAAIPMSLRAPSGAALRELMETLPASWPDDVKTLAAHYAPGRSLTASFLRIMQTLLGGEGLLFVDGFDAARRPEAQAVLRRVAGDSARFHEALQRGTTRLRESLGLAPQVPVRPGVVPVFLFEEGRRVRLFAADSGRVYAAEREDVDLAPALADKTLLHSALSRPLVVESLFPVLGHVLGPAELRYFAQLTDVFPAFGASFPPLAPRAQTVVVPRAGFAALQAAGFGPADLVDMRPSRVREHLTETAWRGHPASKAFPEADYKTFRAALGRYQDGHLSGAPFDNVLRRLDRSFGHYREQARRLVFARSGAEGFRALQPLLRWLAGGPQDRHLNLLSLRAALGPEGFAALVSALRRPDDAISAHVFGVENGSGSEGGSR